ncbi:hypothetical protein PsorP6_003291 [Peronosclerospora sorghi]|uniref:Uncharacterized protein n=1 Tax=Peronosclerospora sorghi TaxID=230839 RepID=A0ACC0VP82_9STRA|nr:hypothetical protein PsorP6_003291 [Peronosclerospora sorghi]
MVIRFSRSLLRCTSISARNGARNRAIPRSFGNAARNSDESLKAEFKHWLKKEVVLLSVMVLAGATGVHFYQNRKNAPVKQVERLLKQAEESAIEGDRKQALKHCLCAYDVIKSTNPNDRHLFELAFAIAAQYENLGRGTPATSYYLDALEHNSRELNVAKRERNQVVTLDRIAQAYENRLVCGFYE